MECAEGPRGVGRTLSPVFRRVNGNRGKSRTTRESAGQAWRPIHPESHESKPKSP
jgi:hypothetical protein